MGRTLLLAVQHAREAMAMDASLSMKAAATLDASRNSDGEEYTAIAVPQLGVGRGMELKTLLEILPLGQLRDAIELHLEELPGGPSKSLLAPFARQTLHLSQ